MADDIIDLIDSLQECKELISSNVTSSTFEEYVEQIEKRIHSVQTEIDMLYYMIRGLKDYVIEDISNIYKLKLDRLTTHSASAVDLTPPFYYAIFTTHDNMITFKFPDLPSFPTYSLSDNKLGKSILYAIDKLAQYLSNSDLHKINEPSRYEDIQNTYGIIIPIIIDKEAYGRYSDMNKTKTKKMLNEIDLKP